MFDLVLITYDGMEFQFLVFVTKFCATG